MRKSLHLILRIAVRVAALGLIAVLACSRTERRSARSFGAPPPPPPPANNPSFATHAGRTGDVISPAFGAGLRAIVRHQPGHDFVSARVALAFARMPLESARSIRRVMPVPRT